MKPKVLFILYYKTPPHTDALIRRADDELMKLHELGMRDFICSVEAKGTPAETLNVTLEKHKTWKYDWVVGWDPHFQWVNDAGYDSAQAVLNFIEEEHKDSRCGYATFLVEQKGIQANGWDKFLKDIPGQYFRLLVAFRVEALQTIGGFKGVPPSGRNWLMATEMQLEDQGWSSYHHPRQIVAVHDDPDLSMEYRFSQSFWAGRDRATLYTHARGHPVLGPGTEQLAQKAAVMKPHNWAAVYHQVHEGIRLLGYAEGAGLIPTETIPPVALTLKVNLDPPTKEEEE